MCSTTCINKLVAGRISIIIIISVTQIHELYPEYDEAWIKQHIQIFG